MTSTAILSATHSTPEVHMSTIKLPAGILATARRVHRRVVVAMAAESATFSSPWGELTVTADGRIHSAHRPAILLGTIKVAK